MLKITHFLPYYIVWHFSRALLDAWSIWKNFLWFVWHFFSISRLSKTLFSPWQRIQEEYGRGSNISFENTFGTLLVNFFMRLVGVLLRGVLIITGVVTWLAVFFAGLAFFVFWIFLPLIIFVLLVSGLALLI